MGFYGIDERTGLRRPRGWYFDWHRGIVEDVKLNVFNYRLVGEVLNGLHYERRPANVDTYFYFLRLAREERR